MDTDCCKAMTWTGRVLSALAMVPFVMGCVMVFTRNPQAVAGMAHYGYPASAFIPIGVIEAVCVVVYLLPPTAVLGALLVTGYLGGAVATHVHAGESPAMPIIVGVLAWLGLFLRESRLRELLPVRGKPFAYEREIVIDRPSADVFAYLRLLKNFQGWNPFLKKDPNAKLASSGTDGEPGYVASWEGNREMGSGEQEITRVIAGRRLEFDLRFKKPFRANNRGYFEAEPVVGGKTRVRWGMSGKTTFPMSLVGLFMSFDTMIGGEFSAGLSRLKELLEKRS